MQARVAYEPDRLDAGCRLRGGKAIGVLLRDRERVIRDQIRTYCSEWASDDGKCISRENQGIGRKFGFGFSEGTPEELTARAARTV